MYASEVIHGTFVNLLPLPASLPACCVGCAHKSTCGEFGRRVGKVQGVFWSLRAKGTVLQRFAATVCFFRPKYTKFVAYDAAIE